MCACASAGSGLRAMGTVMRKLLLAGVMVAALGFAGSVDAADLPVEPVYKGGPLIVPVYDWTGFYLGISGGYSPGNASNAYTITGFAPVGGSTEMNGGVFGGQAGLNWQATRNFVVGLEADLQGTWQNGTDNPPAETTCPAACCTTNVIGVDQKLRWFGTARARLGFLPWDHVMLYITGGAAFGEVESNATITNAVTITIPGFPVVTTTAIASAARAARRGRGPRRRDGARRAGPRLCGRAAAARLRCRRLEPHPQGDPGRRDLRRRGGACRLSRAHRHPGVPVAVDARHERHPQPAYLRAARARRRSRRTRRDQRRARRPAGGIGYPRRPRRRHACGRDPRRVRDRTAAGIEPVVVAPEGDDFAAQRGRHRPRRELGLCRRADRAPRTRRGVTKRR